MRGIPKDLTTASVTRLVELYVAVAVAQFEAREDERIARHNRLYDDRVSIAKELKARLGDQRRELLPLLQHANVQVRFNAAIDLLAVFPEDGKAALRRIHENDWRFYCADAGSLLKSIESGRYVPQ